MSHIIIRINQRSAETKTSQIIKQIAGAISAGKVGRGDVLPSERALAEHLGVSRNIVRNAYARLQDPGLFETNSTSHRRVRPPRARARAAGQGASR